MIKSILKIKKKTLLLLFVDNYTATNSVFIHIETMLNGRGRLFFKRNKLFVFTPAN